MYNKYNAEWEEGSEGGKISLSSLFYKINFFGILGFELRTYTLSLSTRHPPPLFVMGFFEIGPCKLFALADFEM
jgi:hypothetical protein